MAAAAAGHAAFDHAQVVLAAAAAGFAAGGVQADDLGLRVGFQPLPFARDKTGGDQMLFDHAPDGCLLYTSDAADE